MMKMTDDTTPPPPALGDPILLRPLGWSDFFERQLATMDTSRGGVARVVSAQRSRFLVCDGAGERLCAPAGRLMRPDGGDYPVTGDWVLVDDALVLGVIPRRNILSRGDAGARGGRTGGALREQPIAANLDTVFIVCGLDRDFNPRRIERYLALVYNCALRPVVVLTKADLHDDATTFVAQAEAVALGVPVIEASSLDHRGKDELERHLGPGRTVAMLGSSGAGKSTLANMLLGEDVQRTASVSTSMGKGRHTTTTRELIRMPLGGLLLDNPGIREIAFPDAGDGLDGTFADILELAEQCRFADCTHMHEPGCAVVNAVDSGVLDPGRLENYRKMQKEMNYLAERRTKSANRVEKERWQGLAQMKKHMRIKGR